MQIILNIFVRLLQHDYLMAQKSIVSNNGKRGGNLEGKPHKNKQGQDVGGIKAVVTDANNRPVELEGGEVIINKEASKKHWKELSRINQSAGGGVPISKPVDPHDEDPEEYSKGGKIQFNPNKLPNKWILKYAQNIKENHPEIWKKGGNIYGNQAFKNLERVAERGYWLDSEEWFYIKWRSFVARHKGDFRIAGVVAMLKWVDKVDKGWQYMKDLIEAEIKKRSDKKSGWKTKKTERMSGGGELEKGIKTEMEHKDTIEKFKRKGVSDRQVATSIAKDHLKEDPNYYTKLLEMEGKMAKGGTTARQQAKIGYTMREFKEGKLKTSYGKKVTDEKQAIAIALSKAGIEDEEYKNGGRVAPTTSANDVPPYTVQKSDNNGELYISKPTAKGYQQWRKFKGQLLKIGQEVTVNQVNGIIEGINPTEPEKYKVRLENGNTRIVDTSKTTINVLPKGTETKASTQKISGYEVGDKGIYNGKKPIPIEISKITGSNVYFINEETGEQKRSQKENFERLFMPSALTGGTKPTELSEEEFIEHANKEIESWAIPSTDPSTWGATFKVGDRVKIRIDFTTDSTTNTYDYAKIGSYFSKENDFKIISKTSEKAMIRPENPTGTLYTLSNGQNWEGKDLELFVTQQSNKQQTKQEPESGEKPDYYNLFKSNYEVMEYQNNEVVSVVLESFVKMVDEDRLMSTENINEFAYIIDSLR